ncbi:MAG: OmpH family outer membrane protein [Deltaproteobacteria bacterium]|nr:MAG: OmpH family outer membrane protein [Deltaproteobacteria bacterium]
MQLRALALTITFLFGAAGGLTTAPVAQAAEVPQVGRAAVVDLQAVLEKTRHGKRSRAKLERAVADKQKALDKERARLEAQAARLSKLGPAERAKLQRELQEASAKWQQDAMAFEAEVAKMESDMLEEIYANVQRIVRKIGKERGIDLVFVKDQMTIVYVAPSLDLTAEVIRRYDKEHK